MIQNRLLSIPVQLQTRQEIFQKIEAFLESKKRFLHIVSLNPEILVAAQKDNEFRKALSEGDIQICDGIGVYYACKLLGIPCHERISGVDLMEELLQNLNERSLCVLLLGGQGDLAHRLANCYNKQYPKSKFLGLEGYKDINSPSPEEEKYVLTAISEHKPNIIFAAYGSPAQELWFYRHRAQIPYSICMGVGGGFDFLTGKVSRAPAVIRTLGVEWLYRLILQPWRWRRQLRLIEFMYLVAKQKLGFIT